MRNTARQRNTGPAMRQRTSQLLYNYWDDVRNGRLAPRRFEIEPAKIAPILPETFIAECNGSPAYRFRLAGTRLCEQFGRELRGLCMLEPWAAKDREAMETLLYTVVSDGAVGMLEFDAASSDDRQARFEMLVLPLIHAGRTINRLMGNMTAIEPPYWLGSVPLARQSIRSIDLVWPDGQPRFLTAETEAVVATIAPSRSGDEARRRFRVLDGGLAGRPK